ncbi:hypothetical protein HDU96_003958 [Phlyctochytrium bullatum]|nr:hypothetical protein HDU96_003958 [Phlyctochytrium bullatum]
MTASSPVPITAPPRATAATVPATPPHRAMSDAGSDDAASSLTYPLPSPSLQSMRSHPSLNGSARGGTNGGGGGNQVNSTPQKLAETTVGVREAAKHIGRALVKLERPSTLMIVAKAFDPKIIRFTRLLACHLIDTPMACVGSGEGLTVYVDSKFRTHPAFDHASLVATHPHYQDRMKFWTSAFCAQNFDLIDFVVTLGGDGTVLYTSWLFQNSQVPPVIPFHLGSLGFLTNFNIRDIRNVFDRVLGCGTDGVRVNMRMRLSCTVWRFGSRIRGGDVSVNAGSGVSVARPPSTASYATQAHFGGTTAGTATASGKWDDGGAMSELRKANTTMSLPDLKGDEIGVPAGEAAPLSAGPRSGATSGLSRRPSPAPSLQRVNTGSVSGGSATPTGSSLLNVDDLAPSSPGSRLSPFPAVPPSDVGTVLDAICPSLTSRAHPSYDPDESDPRGLGRAAGGTAGMLNSSVMQHRPVPTETFQIINDLVVDRGPSAFMSQLEVYVDDRHLTTVQADGLVISTPTGSTAYSLSAGGSITHPEVPSILVTPICPHTLSFRPMLLPDSIELRIQVPRDSRSTAWASFDGRHRIELRQGDSIVVSLSRYPMPTVCDVDQSTDWFESLRRCLHWNERARQKPFGAASSALPSKPTSASTPSSSTVPAPSPQPPSDQLRATDSAIPCLDPSHAEERYVPGPATVRDILQFSDESPPAAPPVSQLDGFPGVELDEVAWGKPTIHALTPVSQGNGHRRKDSFCEKAEKVLLGEETDAGTGTEFRLLDEDKVLEDDVGYV